MVRILLAVRLAERKWTQAELARKTDIRPNTINALYHEYIKYISVEDLGKICEVLDCEVGDLLEYVKEKKKRV